MVNFERVAVGDDDVGDFPAFQRADSFGQTENLRGVKRDGLERFVVGQAVGDGVGGLLAEPPGERIVEAAERKFDACGGKFGGLGEQAIVGIIFVERLGQRGRKITGMFLERSRSFTL